MLIVFSFIYYDLWAAVKNKKGQPEPATHSIESRPFMPAIGPKWQFFTENNTVGCKFILTFSFYLGKLGLVAAL